MNVFMRVWHGLTDPHPAITDIEQRRQSQLLAGLVVSLFFTSLIASGLLIWLGGGVSGTVIGLWFCIAFMLVVYFINRGGRYRLSAFIFVGFNLAVVCIMPILTGELAWLLFISMVLLLTAMLLPGLTVAVFLVCLFSQVALAVFFPLSTTMSNVSVLIVNGIIGPLVLVFMRQRTQLEKERRQELQTNNVSLRRSEAQLENRVTERTAELRNANEQLQQTLEQINALQEKLHEESIRDPLTGLFNRRYLIETLAREIARAQRDSYHISFMLLDIDHFKKLNDTHGHDAGDDALQALSQKLIACIRTSDIPCRIGGEEFLLVLPGIPDEASLRRAEYFREQIEAMSFPYGSQSLSLTVSIGVASYPRNGATWEELYRAADQALYRAKANGRNRSESA